MLTPENKALIHKCVEGNHRAQAKLYRQYVQAMYNLVIRMVVCSADAEDIIQEVFVRVFRGLHTFKGEATLGAWIKRIAINTTLMHLRKNGKVSFVELGEIEYPVLEVEEVDVEIDMKRVHHAIKKLPEGCRVIFSLYLLEGYKHREIAQILKVSESTSKAQYRRAKMLLRDLLK